MDKTISEFFLSEFGNLFTSSYLNIVVLSKNVLAMQADLYIKMNSADNTESSIVRKHNNNNMQFIKKKIEFYNDNHMYRYNFAKSLVLFIII